MKPRQAVILAALALLLVGLGAFHLSTGDAQGGLHWPESGEIAALRIPRLAIAGVVGASLAVAGVLLQAMLRNPLASPDLLGVTSGAGLGLTVSVFAGFLINGQVGVAPAVQTVAALMGAGATLVCVLAWTHRRGGIDVVSLVLVGVIVGMTCSGLTLLLHHLLPDQGFSARAWFFGSINEDLGVWMIAGAALALAACLAVALTCSRQIDAACLAEDEARSIGVRLARLRMVLLVASGVLATVAVVLAGPIGFVGLIVPHAVRLVIGPHHKPLLVGATLGGACVVIATDAAVSLLPLGHGRLPVGVVMAIVGGPAFLVLLRSLLRGASL